MHGLGIKKSSCEPFYCLYARVVCPELDAEGVWTYIWSLRLISECFCQMALLGFSFHLMPRPGLEPTSLELHRPGTFWRTLYRLSYRAADWSLRWNRTGLDRRLGCFPIHLVRIISIFSFRPKEIYSFREKKQIIIFSPIWKKWTKLLVIFMFVLVLEFSNYVAAAEAAASEAGSDTNEAVVFPDHK